MARFNWLARIYNALAGAPDAAIYYDLIGTDGQVKQQNVKLVVKNTVAQEGTPHTPDNDNQLVQFADGDSTATPNTFMKRDANGRSKVAAPSANDDVATKGSIYDVISEVRMPTQTIYAMWSETINTGTITKTISHSLGAIPGKVKVWFRYGQYIACVIVEYNNGTYNYTMLGCVRAILSSKDSFTTWKANMLTSGALFGMIVNSPEYSYAGSYSLGEYGSSLYVHPITISSTSISIPIQNAGSQATLSTSVTVEVFK